MKKIFDESKYILIVFAPTDNGDAATSALALRSFFAAQHKQVDVVSDRFILPKNLHFLPHADEVKKELTHLQKFIIKVDVSKAPIDTLSYDVRDNWLSIYLTPKHGVITKHELRTAQTTFKYDLVICLNTPDLPSLGDIFANNTDLFYRVPILNIDYQASNERHGQINLIDLTSTSTSEVVYNFLKQISDTMITEEIATYLLTGMIVATKSFKNAHITPHSLHLASELINRGADREKINHHLYRTRSISTLKLWGQALTHLEHRPDIGLVWTCITREDFVRSGGVAEDLRGISDELISNSPEAKITLLLYEGSADTKSICGIITADKNYDASQLVRPLVADGNRKQATIRIENKTLAEAEDMVVRMIAERTKIQ